jgi:hypothetical protein
MVAYLRSVPPIANPNAPAPKPPDAIAGHVLGASGHPQGEQIYAEACASCHGWTGKSPISGLATIAGRSLTQRSVRPQCRASHLVRRRAPAGRSGHGDAGLRRRLFGRRDRGRRQLCHGALRRRGLAPDSGQRRLTPAHPVTDHLLRDLFVAAIRPWRLIKSSGPLVFLVGGALRWLRRENEHALGHFLERSTQFDVALQQSALISREALTAPARAMAIRRQPGAIQWARRFNDRLS